MKRRTVIAGLGGITASSMLAVGSGAFTSVSADRTVSITTAPDYGSVLTLVQRGRGERSKFDGTPSELEFELPGSDEDEYPVDNPTDPEGLGTDSVYRFSRDAAAETPGLFGVENRGTRRVCIYGTQTERSGVPDVDVYDVDSEALLTPSSPSVELSPGERILCGLQVDTHGVPVREAAYEIEVTINAVVSDA